MKPLFALRDFLRRESSSSFLLVIAALFGIGLANSPLSDSYNNILSTGFKLDFPYFYLSLTVTKIINYVLMSFFFLVVGMEIKRELLSGHLSSIKKAATPFAAALGGMVVPALIYLSLVKGEAARGWAIPMATDIALAVGVLAFMGNRVSFAMKAFLLALAVIDDIGAIAIIAIFYTDGVSLPWLFSGFSLFCFIFLFYKFGYNSRLLVTFASLGLWYSFYRCGIHPTLAGVLIGFALPQSEHLEEKVHSWSSYLIVPLFALANTGVEISKSAISSAFTSVVALGIFLGMVLGKPLGILLFTKIATSLNLAEAPKRSGKFSLLATGSAAGIGFTVAIFIAELAFEDPKLQELAIIAVIAASVVSGVISILLNRISPIQQDSSEE